MRRKLVAVCLLPLLLVSLSMVGFPGNAAVDSFAWMEIGGCNGVYDLVWTGTHVYAGCYDGHVYRFNGGDWTDTGRVADNEIRCLAWTGTHLYAGSWNSHVYRYDGGTTWTDTGLGAEAYIVFSLAWDGTYLYAGDGNGRVYRYDGTTWTDKGLENGGSYVLSLAWNGSNLYAGCYNGHIYRCEGGTTWTDIGGIDAIDDLVWILRLVWDGTHLYAGCRYGHVYRYDGGTTWTDIGAVGVIGVNGLIWNGTNLYAACDTRVSRYDGGTTWTDMGLQTATDIFGLAWDGSNLYAGSSSSVYKGSASLTTTTWYIAEGASAGGFETWILVQNPGTETAQVTLTYMTDAGEVQGPVFDVGPGSRASKSVGDTVQTMNVSTKVTSTKPVVAERAVYYNNRQCATGSIGFP